MPNVGEQPLGTEPSPPCIKTLGTLHAIPHRTRFAMDLCLEEVLSNIIRHGYNSSRNGIIRIRCLAHWEGDISLVVDEEAPRFNPLANQRPLAPIPVLDIPMGGRGTHLLK